MLGDEAILRPSDDCVDASKKHDLLISTIVACRCNTRCFPVKLMLSSSFDDLLRLWCEDAAWSWALSDAGWISFWAG